MVVIIEGKELNVDTRDKLAAVITVAVKNLGHTQIDVETRCLTGTNLKMMK